MLKKYQNIINQNKRYIESIEEIMRRKDQDEKYIEGIADKDQNSLATLVARLRIRVTNLETEN